MPQLFISYRREESAEISGRIRDLIGGRYPKATVFLDVEAIRTGTDFREAIRDAVAHSSVMLVVIGQEWLQGDEALADDDFIRTEIELAFEFDVHLVPVLVHGASMPAADQLPEGIRDLAYRNAIEVGGGKRFRGDAETLREAIHQFMAGGDPAPWARIPFDPEVKAGKANARRSLGTLMPALVGLGSLMLAWVLWMVIMASLEGGQGVAPPPRAEGRLGWRLYMDTCAHCHGEDGMGRRDPDAPGSYLVHKLRDTPNLALAESPYALLTRVVTGGRGADGSGLRMPAWGPRLTNEEIISVVNYVRTSWGHDASTIDPRHRKPPPGILELEEDILDALINKDPRALGGPEGARPQLYRTDGPRWAVGREHVMQEWEGYFEALGRGEILDFQLTDTRYSEGESGALRVGVRVFAMGRIFLSTLSDAGKRESESGRFIRVYQRMREPKARDEIGPEAAGPEWALIFDFASIHMRVGAEPLAHTVEPAPTASTLPVVSAQGIGYAQVQGYFRALNQDSGDAPHERFWELPYKEFVAFKFPFSWDNVDDEVQLLVVGSARESNMIKALLDGVGIEVATASGRIVRRNIQPMPKGGKMPLDNVAKIAAWINAGCPEFAAEGRGDAAGPPKGAGSGGRK